MRNPTDRVVVYLATDGWRWHMQAAGNHKILADGGQGYSRKYDAIKGAARVTHCALVEPDHPNADGDTGWVLPLYILDRSEKR